jgi:predicted NAD/FAD-dependent oxidoreductase
MHGLGGRMATRVIDPQPLVFDHAAQFFTCDDERFQKFVDRWLDKGLICDWKGKIGELEAGGNFIPIQYSRPRYVGVNGMRFLADSILNEVLSLSLTHTQERKKNL